MKTLRSIMLGLVLLALCGIVKATDKPGNERLTQTPAINTYIAAMTTGKLDGFNDVLDQNAKFDLLRGTKLCSFDKKQVLNHMQLNADVEQNCMVSTSVMEGNNSVAMVKVDMKYPDFVRSNYISMVNTGDGWKITNVYSVFK